MKRSPRRSLSFPGAAQPEPAHRDELSSQQADSTGQLSAQRVPSAASEPAHTRPGSAFLQADSAAELQPEQCSTPRRSSQTSATGGLRRSRLHSSEVNMDACIVMCMACRLSASCGRQSSIGWAISLRSIVVFVLLYCAGFHPSNACFAPSLANCRTACCRAGQGRSPVAQARQLPKAVMPAMQSLMSYMTFFSRLIRHCVASLCVQPRNKARVMPYEISQIQSVLSQCHRATLRCPC